MIKIRYDFSKEKLNKKSKEDYLLIALEGEKLKKDESIKRPPLNISFVVDASSSMETTISGSMRAIRRSSFGLPRDWNEENILPRSRMELVKEAVALAVSELNKNDFVSLVAFNEEGRVVSSPLSMTEANKVILKNRVESLKSNGLTNLHAGWLLGAQEVAKNMSEETLNRIIILSDGHLNRGVTDHDIISSDVLKLNKTSISTTTFGVGKDFNEDLLQEMSYSGGGNSYYIENETDIVSSFSKESLGLHSLIAKSLKLSINFKESFSLAESCHDFKEDNGFYLLPNLSEGRNVSLIFKVNTVLSNKMKEAAIANITLFYKDKEGVEKTQTVEVKKEVVSATQWNKLPLLEEVHVKTKLFEIAKRKEEAIKAMDTGNISNARLILEDTLFASKNDQFNQNESVLREVGRLTNTLSTMDSKEAGLLRKDLSYQSYNVKSGLE